MTHEAPRTTTTLNFVGRKAQSEQKQALDMDSAPQNFAKQLPATAVQILNKMGIDPHNVSSQTAALLLNITSSSRTVEELQQAGALLSRTAERAQKLNVSEVAKPTLDVAATTAPVQSDAKESSFKPG
jgi:hypothetical protein